jgi:hypothetical protein
VAEFAARRRIGIFTDRPTSRDREQPSTAMAALATAGSTDRKSGFWLGP